MDMGLVFLLSILGATGLATWIILGRQNRRALEAANAERQRRECEEQRRAEARQLLLAELKWKWNPHPVESEPSAVSESSSGGGSYGCSDEQDYRELWEKYSWPRESEPTGQGGSGGF